MRTTNASGIAVGIAWEQGLKGHYRRSKKTVIKKNEEKMNQAGIKKMLRKGEGIFIEFKE